MKTTTTHPTRSGSAATGRAAALTLAAAAVLGLAAPPANAASLKRQNLTQLIADSQSIVSGTVVRVTDGVAENGLPYTEVTLHVSGTSKGRIAAGAEYTFRQFGLLKPRKMANGKTLLAVSPEGFPRWAEGESVVAFLHQPASVTGLQTTAGLAQGKLQLTNGKLLNQFENANLFDGVQIDSRLLSPEESQMINTAGAVDADTFVGLLGRAVAEQWIENGNMQ